MHEALEKHLDTMRSVGRPRPVAPVPSRLRHTREGMTRPRSVPEFSAFFSRLASRSAACLEDERDHGHVFLFLPVFMGTGAILWFAADDPPKLFVLILLFCGLACLGVVSRYRNPCWHYVLLASMLMTAGSLFAVWETARLDTVMLDSPVTTHITGIIEQREEGASGEWRYIVRIAQTREPQLRRPPSRVSLVARADHRPFMIGAAIEGRARLSPPSGPALPGLNDFAFSAYFDGIGAIGFFLGAPDVGDSTLSDQPQTDFLTSAQRALASYLLSVRGAIGERIRTAIGGDEGAFAAAIVTGERRALSEPVLDDLRRSGLAHVIAISGLHMALAAGLFFVGLRVVLSQFTGFAQSRPIKKYAAAGALVAAFFYLMISGAQVSAQRAFVMMAIMLMAVLLDRPAISMRNVALAATIILAISPSEVMGPSFQMSFAATVALVAGYSAWRFRRSREGYFDFLPDMPIAGAIIRVVGGLILTSVIGGLSTAIFSLEHFHRLAGYSLPANLLAMPIITFVVMPAGLVSMLLMPIGLDRLPLDVMGHGLGLVIAIAHTVAEWGGDVGSARLARWVLPLAVTGMLILALLRSRIRHIGTAILAGGLITGLALPKDRTADLLIYEDGRLVGLIGNGADNADVIATTSARPPGFIFTQWQNGLQRHSHQKPAVEEDALLAEAIAPRDIATPDGGRRFPVLSENAIRYASTKLAHMLDMSVDGQFSCLNKVWCVARISGGWRVVTLEEPRLSGLACDLGDIVISARRLGYDHCRSGARLITPDTLRKTGSLEIWLGPHSNGAIALRSAFSGRARPWSLHRRYDWRSGRYDMKLVETVLTDLSGSGGSGRPAYPEP